jgi:hypothetical protein
MKIPLTLLLILLLPVQSWAVIAVVQSVGFSTSGVSLATTSNMTTTSTNLIICDAAAYLSGAAFDGTPVTDSKSNAYVTAISEIASASDSEARATQVYKENATGGASHNFTLTMTGNASIALACKEVSGALTSGALDKTSTKVDNSGATNNTSDLTATTVQADELLAGGGSIAQGLGATISFTATGSFTTDQSFPNVDGGAFGLISASKVVSATSTYQFTYDLDAAPDGSLGWISTWNASGGAAAPAVRRRPMILQ